MLYDCKPNIQSQKRCTMDSLKETDKPAPNPSKHPRIEVDEELMRQMIADRPLWIRKGKDIPRQKIGKAWKFKYSELEKWARSGNAADRKSTRLNSSHPNPSRMPSSA